MTLPWSLLACTGSPPAPVEAPAPEPAEAPEPEPTKPEPEPAIDAATAERLLFPGGLPEPVPCAPGPGYVCCLLGLRYEGHASAARDALALYDELGDVAGIEPEQDMDGGFRGTIHLVPALPVGERAQHLAWVLAAQREIASFIAGIEANAQRPVRYRHRALGWRFTRSVGRATPSAYASGWQIGYNVSGSLLRSADGVRDTFFHELFHLNDQAHGHWSRRVLGELVDGLVARCEGTGRDPSGVTECLGPYAPTRLKVRGGTWYAFQPDNGDMANEYAAELAQRYFLEQRAALRGEAYALGRFACGTPENARAMTALADEFFGGVQLGPPCE